MINYIITFTTNINRKKFKESAEKKTITTPEKYGMKKDPDY